ncbi:MAG: glycosyl hydrolase, partial [Armatimonadota bacterium]|nr:glycosyl hydrolase [Armatimonadota bacterium]
MTRAWMVEERMYLWVRGVTLRLDPRRRLPARGSAWKKETLGLVKRVAGCRGLARIALQWRGAWLAVWWVLPLAWVPSFAAPAPTERVVRSSGSLSVGKFYRFSRKPDGIWRDQLPTRWSDGAKLTDEEVGIEGRRVYSMKRFVGWSGAARVDITLDLGCSREVTSVGVHLAAGQATRAAYPRRVGVLTREEGEWALYATTASLPRTPDGVSATWVELAGAPRRARFVTVRLEPSEADQKILVDEIDVRGVIENRWRYVPDTGCYHGAFPVDEKGNLTIAAFEQQVGKSLAMVLWYHAMGRDAFAGLERVHRDVVCAQDRRRFLCVGWLPDLPASAIAEGALDAYFEGWFTAAASAELPTPLWIRPMNEMNSTWVKWGLDPQNFRRAWRRMYNIAEQLGVTRRHPFVWSPNHRSYPDEFWNKMGEYYPGDPYVDWVGVSVYPPDSPQRDDPDRYPSRRLQECYDLFSLRKPMMIAEGGFSDSVDRVRWVKEWFSDLPQKYPGIKAFIWENHHTRRIELDAAALEAYRTLVAGPYWLGSPWGRDWDTPSPDGRSVAFTSSSAPAAGAPPAEGAQPAAG